MGRAAATGARTCEGIELNLGVDTGTKPPVVEATSPLVVEGGNARVVEGTKPLIVEATNPLVVEGANARVAEEIISRVGAGETIGASFDGASAGKVFNCKNCKLEKVLFGETALTYSS